MGEAKRKAGSEASALPSLADVMRVDDEVRRFEAEPRNKDGKRHVGHRFPIKGGITAADVVVAHVCAINPLFEKLIKGRRRGGAAHG